MGQQSQVEQVQQRQQRQQQQQQQQQQPFFGGGSVSATQSGAAGGYSSDKQSAAVADQMAMKRAVIAKLLAQRWGCRSRVSDWLHMDHTDCRQLVFTAK
jgi:hypothetical protein